MESVTDSGTESGRESGMGSGIQSGTASKSESMESVNIQTKNNIESVMKSVSAKIHHIYLIKSGLETQTSELLGQVWNSVKEPVWNEVWELRQVNNKFHEI